MIRDVIRASAILASLAAPALGQAHRVDRELELEPPSERSRVPSAVLEHVTTQPGTLSVWAECDTADLVLRLELADGTLLGHDDDTGGGRNPWVRSMQDQAGRAVLVRVEAKSLDAPPPTRIRVCVRELPETEGSRAANQAAEEALKEARALDAAGDRLAAVRRLAEAIDAYCAVEGVRESVSFLRTLMFMARQSLDWLDAPTFLRASLARRDAMRGLFPPTSEAWSEVQYAVCQGMSRASRPRDALPECERAFELARSCFPPESPNLPIFRAELAQAHLAARDLETAFELLEDAAGEAERCPELDDVRRAMLRGRLGDVLFQLGSLDEALRVQREALDVLEGSLPEDDENLRAARNNLAAVLSSIGDTAEALEMHERLCARAERHLPREHPESILARYNRAAVRMSAGDAPRALQDLQELRADQERGGSRRSALGDSIDVGLAEALRRTGGGEAALEVLAERERIREQEGRSDAITSWRLTSSRSQALIGLGRVGEALEAAERALELALASMPPENPDLAEARQLVAALCLRAGRRDRGLELARAAVEDARGYFSRCALSLTMRQAEAAQAHWSRLVADGVTLLAAAEDEGRRSECDRLAFELCESARGVGLALLRAWNDRAGRADGTSASLDRLRSELRVAARDVARSGEERAGADELRSALERRSEAERELRDALRDSLGPWTGDGPRAEAIARGLAADEALIAYWRCDARPLDAAGGGGRTPRLLAFVVRSDGRVTRFDLGTLEPIAASVERWRAAAASGDLEQAPRELESGAELRERILGPLAAALEGARTWRAVLDDVLHLVALDALPEGEARLGDRVRVVVAPAAWQGPSRTGAAASSDRLVALGGVDYEVANAPAPASAPMAARARRFEGWSTEFEPLWETQEEIDGVAKLFRRARTTPEGNDPRVILLSERDATKAALIAAAADARYLHVATHGFFALDPAREGSKVLGVLADRSPLTLCGLALAGANSNDAEHALDGVITADELATLDLSGCELAVLSACDTNVGTLAAGQGVASFQKALHAAGARHVVTSLWKVDDAAARELMLAFYQAFWLSGRSPRDALWDAKCALRRRRAPVRDWAAWTLSE